MIETEIISNHLKSLLKQYRNSENDVLKNYTIKLASDYIKGSTEIVSSLVKHEGQASADQTLEEIEYKPDYFEERIEKIIGYIETNPNNNTL